MSKESFVISRWSTLIENLNESPKRFYELVDTSIRKKELPDIKISESEMKEAGFFSSKRVYFTVERRNYTLDICGAPYGSGFFVSSWLSYSVGFFTKILMTLAMIPGLGIFVAPFVADVTLYQKDTTDAFFRSVHGSVIDVIDEITKVRGLRMLSESERKPVMSEFYLPKMLKR